MKARASKLDPYAEQLSIWFLARPLGGEGLTYLQAQNRLAELGCKVSVNALFRWWQSWQRSQLQRQMLADIASGAQFNRQLEKTLGANPPPELQTLIKLIRTLVAQLAVNGAADVDTLKLVAHLTALVMEHEKSRAGHELKMRELTQRAEIAERQSADRAAALKLEREKFELQFADALRKAMADAQLHSLLERKAGNAEIIAHLRQTYFSDIDALQQGGSVQLPQ